jgi:hypothetical protein
LNLLNLVSVSLAVQWGQSMVSFRVLVRLTHEALCVMIVGSRKSDQSLKKEPLSAPLLLCPLLFPTVTSGLWLYSLDMLSSWIPPLYMAHLFF